MQKGETVVSGAPHPGTELEVLESPAGFYLGYLAKSGEPYSRETQYFTERDQAEAVLSFFRGYECETGMDITIVTRRYDQPYDNFVKS